MDNQQELRGPYMALAQVLNDYPAREYAQARGSAQDALKRQDIV
jgi:hypothetical protein